MLFNDIAVYIFVVFKRANQAPLESEAQKALKDNVERLVI